MFFSRAKKIRTLALIVGISVFAGLFFLVTDTKSSDKSISTQRYVKSIFRPKTFDSRETNEVAAVTVANLIYSGLLEFTPDLKLKSDLASTWRTSPDGKSIFIELKPGLRFHDNSSLTTKHVINSLARLMAPDSPSFNHYSIIEGAKEYHAGLRTSVTGLLALSERELVIRLVEPFPAFLSILAGSTAKILPISDLETFNARTFFKRPVGSGPFQFEESTPDKTILRRFAAYHGNLPHISELILDHASQSDAFQLAKRNQVHDLISWIMSGQEEIFQHGQHVGAMVAETVVIGLNTRFAPFNDVAIRRSFKRDIPNDEYRRQFYPDTLKAYGFIPPLLPGHLNGTDTNSGPAASCPSRTPIKIALCKEIFRADEMKTFFETNLRQKGWNVTVTLMPWNELIRKYDNKSLQGFVISMNMDYPDPEFLFRNFQADHPDNFSGINNPEIKRLLIKARHTESRIERETVYKTLSMLIANEAVTVELFHTRGHYWLHPCVRGFVPNTLSYVYTDYRTIYLDEQCMKRNLRIGTYND